LELSQQPVQAGLQTQVCASPQACAGEEQTAQAAPASPQAAAVSAVWQAPFSSQQPVGHDLASQTQTPAPASHVWPAVQPPLPAQGWPQLSSAPPQSPAHERVQHVPWLLHSWPETQLVVPEHGWPQLLRTPPHRPAHEGVQQLPV
jgi:hypothetical protein